MITPTEKRVNEISNQLDKLFGKKKKKVVPPPRKSTFSFPYQALQPKPEIIIKEAPSITSADILAIVRPIILETFLGTEKPSLEITPKLVKEIVQIMHALPENDKLEVSKGIRNAASFIFNGTKYGTHEMMHGGSAVASSVPVYNEIVSGGGTMWTLANTPVPGSLRLYANGQRLTQTVDYSVSVATITTVLSWTAGTLLADYNY